MLNSLELVSISDFILSALCIFLAGALFGNVKSHSSRAGMLSYFLLFAGLAAFMGGIDHGFFQPKSARYIPRTLTYILVAFATFFLFRYTIITFFNGKIGKILKAIAYLQLIAFVGTSFYLHNFLLVVGNYSPILILFFAMNLKHMKKQTSEFDFSMFCIIMILGTVVQVLEIELSTLINGDTLYHIIAFVGYFFIFSGVVKITKMDIRLLKMKKDVLVNNED